jgi:hypothetical protein
MPAASRDCCSEASESSNATDTGAVHTTSPVADRVMRARTSHDRSLFCNSPLTTKSACGTPLVDATVRGADTRIFSIFANPSVRRVVTVAAMAVTSLSLSAAIGITAMVGGLRPDSTLGPTIVTTASATSTQRAATANATGRRRPNRRDDGAASAVMLASAGETATGNGAGASVVAGPVETSAVNR